MTAVYRWAIRAPQAGVNEFGPGRTRSGDTPSVEHQNAEEAERKRREEEERQRREGLNDEVARWRQAQDIREYCRTLAMNRSGAEVTARVQWALEYADSIDPLSCQSARQTPLRDNQLGGVTWPHPKQSQR